MKANPKTIEMMEAWSARLLRLGFQCTPEIDSELSIFRLRYHLSRETLASDKGLGLGMVSFMPVTIIYQLRTAYPLHLAELPNADDYTYQGKAEVGSYFSELEQLAVTLPYADAIYTGRALAVYKRLNVASVPEDYPYEDIISALGLTKGNVPGAMRLMHNGYTSELATTYGDLPLEYVKEIHGLSVA